MTGSLVHLELHTTDAERAVDFLSRLVGWEAEQICRPHGSYLALQVGRRLGGGVVECGAEPGQWVPYVTVDDVPRSVEQAQQMGATVLVAPRDSYRGRRSVIATPSTGVIALWQPTS